MNKKPEPMKEIEKSVQGEAYLEDVETGQWPRGVFYHDAYALVSNYDHIKPDKTLTSGQKERGRALTERLRAQLQARMITDGWRPVGNTRAGLEIWQHPKRVTTSARDQDQPVQAQSVISEQETGIAQSESDYGTPGSSQDMRLAKRTTRAITFTCQWCRQEVTEQRFPAHTPLYCSNPTCKKEATRVKAHERVTAWRKAHPNARRIKR